MDGIAAFPSPVVKLSFSVRPAVEGQTPFYLGHFNGAVRLAPGMSKGEPRSQRNASVLVVANWPYEGAFCESNIIEYSIQHDMT